MAQNPCQNWSQNLCSVAIMKLCICSTSSSRATHLSKTTKRATMTGTETVGSACVWLPFSQGAWANTFYQTLLNYTTESATKGASGAKEQDLIGVGKQGRGQGQALCISLLSEDVKVWHILAKYLQLPRWELHLLNGHTTQRHHIQGEALRALVAPQRRCPFAIAIAIGTRTQYGRW